MLSIAESDQLLREYTKLKPGQRKAITNIINEYDDPQDLIYETIGLLNDGISYKRLTLGYKTNLFMWDTTCYEEFQSKRDFRDKMLSTPPEVTEGEMECPKCNMTKTFVVEMQTRSADEGCTYYIHCFNPKCKKITKT